MPSFVGSFDDVVQHGGEKVGHPFFMGLLCTLFTVGVAPVFAAGQPPQGFQDSKIFSDVMSGSINNQTITNTDLEQQLYLRSYYNKVSPQAYAQLAISFEKYPDLFEEVESAETVSVNSAKNVFRYKMDIALSYGLIPLRRAISCCNSAAARQGKPSASIWARSFR